MLTFDENRDSIFPQLSHSLKTPTKNRELSPPKKLKMIKSYFFHKRPQISSYNPARVIYTETKQEHDTCANSILPLHSFLHGQMRFCSINGYHVSLIKRICKAGIVSSEREVGAGESWKNNREIRAGATVGAAAFWRTHGTFELQLGCSGPGSLLKGAVFSKLGQGLISLVSLGIRSLLVFLRSSDWGFFSKSWTIVMESSIGFLMRIPPVIGKDQHVQIRSMRRNCGGRNAPRVSPLTRCRLETLAEYQTRLVDPETVSGS